MWGHLIRIADAGPGSSVVIQTLGPMLGRHGVFCLGACWAYEIVVLKFVVLLPNVGEGSECCD